jgi:GTP 3',8-cyclase
LKAKNMNRLVDPFGRPVTYLRISVTDRCNLRCTYCEPREMIERVPRERLLTLEEIQAFAQTACASGITKIRLTGGEPLLRRNIVHLVRLLSSIRGLRELALTTNGTRLKELALPLKEAGLQRVNISLDTLNPLLFARITRGGNLQSVLEGITAAKEAGLEPVKINCVLVPGLNDDGLDALREFCRERGLILQLIQAMNLAQREYVFRRDAEISRPPDCHGCNKLRLTCDGRLFPCLFSAHEVQVRDWPDYHAALECAVGMKPLAGGASAFRAMAEIGG